jgi:hypothetical protein
MGRLRATSIILAPLLAALALSACGGGSSAKLLPGTTASQINQNLEQVRQRVGEGNCEGAEEATAAVTTQIDELGNGVDQQLKTALTQGAKRLNEVVEHCQESGEGEAEELEETAEQEEIEAEEEEQAAFEEEEQAQEKEQKSQEKEEKTHQKEEEKEEKGLEEEGPPGKAKGHEETGEEPIEESESPVPPVTPEGESGGIGPGGVAE